MNKPIREVTKQNPCEHCGKPDWCYTIGNLSVCNRDNPPADGWYQTNKTDRDGHFYYAPIQDLPQKQSRQSQTRTWEYLDRSGNKLVRVVRIDNSSLSKIIWQEYWLEHPDLAKFRTDEYWVKLSVKDYDKGKCTKAQWELFNELKEKKRQHIPIYRYQEIKQALKENKTIFIVEGESCADKLWELGIPATTNIGGSKKWHYLNSQDLILAKSNPSMILCPDRDKPGVEHMERIYQDFPSAQWLYAFPQSPLWNISLPLSDGLDIADWIDELKDSYRLDRSETIKTIYESIEGYRNLSVNNVNKLLSNSDEVSNSVVNKSVNNPVNNRQQSQHFHKLNAPQMTKVELIAKLHEIIDIAPKKSIIITLFFQLSKETGRSVSQIEKLYNELIKEIDRESERPVQKQEIKQLLTLESTHLQLKDYLPVEMVKPLNHIAEILGSNSSSQLTALLPVVASLINPDTKLILIKSSKFYARPIFYSAIIGESGSAKSPTMKIFSDPLTQYMQGKAENVYQRQLAEYEIIKADKSIENKPPKPKAIEYYVTDCTSECVAQIINDQPNKGFLMLFDELSGLIKQNNAYRGGKGADQEKILSGRDGTGWKVNRKSGDRFNNSRSTYSILGGITPDILRQQMGSCQDESGYWARFVYSYLPVKKCKFPDDELNIDIYPMLCSLYENLERLPATEYHLCPVGTAIYQDFFNEMEEMKITDSHQAMRAVYAKFKRVAGEIALLLQSLHKAFYYSEDDENGTNYLFPEFMAMGIELAKRYIAEIKAIYLRHEGSDEKSISPIYSRIINLSERKGWLKARDLKQGDRFFRKLNTVEIRHHFQNLIDLGFGVIRGVGKAVEWCFGEGQKKEIQTNKNQNYSYAYIASEKVKNEKFVDNVDNVDTVVDVFVDSQNKSETITNSEIEASTPVNVDNVDNNQVKSEKLIINNNFDSIINNNFDSIVCSSYSEPSDFSDILEDSSQTQKSKLRTPRTEASNSLNPTQFPVEHNRNIEVSNLNSQLSKYEGLYVIVPKQYSRTGILVDLREENGYLWGRQSGLNKFIKVPFSQIIEYKHS